MIRAQSLFPSPPDRRLHLPLLRDRISGSPRIMPCMRPGPCAQAPDADAASDPRVLIPQAPAAVPLPSRHRRDQEPACPLKRLTDLATSSPLGDSLNQSADSPIVLLAPISDDNVLPCNSSQVPKAAARAIAKARVWDSRTAALSLMLPLRAVSCAHDLFSRTRPGA